MTFSRPDGVFLDACHSADGYHPGPLTTLDGLVAALSEQGGWVDVTAPTEISVDGYDGYAFQHTAPAEFVDCSTRYAPFRSMENVDEYGSKGWSYYSEGEVETLWVLDVDGDGRRHQHEGGVGPTGSRPRRIRRRARLDPHRPTSACAVRRSR